MRNKTPARVTPPGTYWDECHYCQGSGDGGNVPVCVFCGGNGEVLRDEREDDLDEYGLPFGNAGP